MNSLHIYDIFVLVCTKIPFRQLIKLKLISKMHQNIIANNDWIHNPVYIRDNYVLKYILDNYQFKNLDISQFCDANVNIYIDKLKECHTLQIPNSNMTPDNIKKLNGCHSLDLRQTNITDETIKKFKYCYKLCLSLNNITNKYIKNFKNCHTIHLSFTKINDESIKFLKNCYKVNLNGTLVTDKGIIKLRNCHTVYLAGTNVTSKCLKKLHCKKFILYGCVFNNETIKTMDNLQKN